MIPSVRRKYTVTVCPILPENVTRKVADVVTTEQGPATLNETQTLLAGVPSGFLIVPVKDTACGVAVAVGGLGVGVAAGFTVTGAVVGAFVGRGVVGGCVAVGTGVGVGLGDSGDVGAAGILSAV